MKLSDRFSRALAYTNELHADHQRKVSGDPYISHLLRVAGIALEYGASEDEAIAALLHDAVEDQGGDKTRQEISRLFGKRVVEIIDGCTDTDQVPKPPWRERKEAYLSRLGTASGSVRLVSASDKLDNVRSILISHRIQGESVWDKFSGGRDGLRWYHRSVVETLKRAGVTPLVDELDRVVSELERTIARETGKRTGAKGKKKSVKRRVAKKSP
ncbi:MAG: HD domain-containing protein [Planctomycetes bacterium]|nr:HD domain-containing protein [Planctomycetota bacterium]